MSIHWIALGNSLYQHICLSKLYHSELGIKLLTRRSYTVSPTTERIFSKINAPVRGRFHV